MGNAKYSAHMFDDCFSKLQKSLSLPVDQDDLPLEAEIVQHFTTAAATKEKADM